MAESSKTAVLYEDFGAVGDGVANDFFAIKAAHEYANENGVTVKACPGKTYLISDTRNERGEVETVPVKTDVIWSGANFIIEDTDISNFDGTNISSKDIFLILPDSNPYKIDDEKILSEIVSLGLNKETEKIKLPGVNEPVMIIPYNSAHRVYRRRGFGSHTGGIMHEVIILDKDGIINEETRVLFDYKNLDYIEVYPLTDKPITIEGGTFTTRASRIDILERDADGKVMRARNGYIQRGIEVFRSHTTVKGVKHYVEGEITLAEQASGILGPTYNGFFGVTLAHAVTFEDCVLTGKRCFRKNNVEGAGSGTSGSYDYTVNDSNKVVFRNCVQSNFWITIDEKTGEIKAADEHTPGAQLSMTPTAFGNINFKIIWGLGGSNYTKNMEFIGSTMSRFDAHAGLMNGKIIDSTVNAISLVGGGNMLIENSRWIGEGRKRGDSLFGMRGDYGSPWDGKVTVRNVKAYINKNAPVYLIGHGYLNWYCGYQSCFPNVEVENLKYYFVENGEPVPRGYEILLMNDHLKEEPSIHLDTVLNSHPCYAKVDLDGDGYVDGTNIVFDGVESNKGIIDESSLKNVNPVKPPEYIKITKNETEYVFITPETSKYGLSDGGYYSDADTVGGFFGGTKFYYGELEDEYYLGTNHDNTKTYKFN